MRVGGWGAPHVASVGYFETGRFLLHLTRLGTVSAMDMMAEPLVTKVSPNDVMFNEHLICPATWRTAARRSMRASAAWKLREQVPSSILDFACGTGAFCVT